MKIRHYGKSWPKKLKIPLTKEEDNFFRFLELSPDFEKEVIDIRKKYQIPANGFPTTRESDVGLGIPKYLDYEVWDQYLEDESSISDLFGFTGSWDLSLSYFIKYNYMPKMAEKVVPRAAIFDGDTTLLQLQNDYPATRKRKVYIGVSQNLSKEQLKALIDLQWNQISDLMQGLPKWDAKKHSNVDLFRKLTFLRDIKKMPWGEIAANLGEQYSENDSVMDESYLRTLYRRYKNRLKKLPKVPVSHTSRGK